MEYYSIIKKNELSGYESKINLKTSIRTSNQKIKETKLHIGDKNPEGGNKCCMFLFILN